VKKKPDFIPLPNFQEYPPEEMEVRAEAFFHKIRQRRTVRDFSDRQFPQKIIETCLRAAGTAPSGANLQPWQFVVITDPKVKTKIRIAAEEEEREFYSSRAPVEWLTALEPLGTDWEKPFLETAPFLIAIFFKNYDLLADGRKVKNYYAMESVGIATGLLIAALHHAGLATLTHTPSPMAFLNEILNRPKNEHPFLLLVVGYPTDEAKVPNISKKPLEEIATFI
jgi:iodotyrosine deiodinase